jgi:hypothetical protein
MGVKIRRFQNEMKSPDIVIFNNVSLRGKPAQNNT